VEQTAPGQQVNDWERLDYTDPAAAAWSCARKIAGIYALVACLWILTSDAAAHAIAGGILTEQSLQTIKGIAYVLVTSALLWWLVYLHMKKICESQTRLSLILERMPIACIIEDKEFRISTWNSTAEKIYGFSKSDAIGRTTHETIVPPSSKFQVEELHKRLLEGRMKETEEMFVLENRTRDGRMILCEWKVTLLLGRKGEFIGLLGMVTDVTERERVKEELSQHREHLEELVKKRTAELEKSNRELQQLEKFRDNLINMIVHDMRSPLQVILGNLELIKLTPRDLDTGIQNSLHAAETGANKLLHSISELLDIRKLESGQMPLKRAFSDIGTLTSQAIQDLKPLSAGHTMLWTSPVKPAVVNCDPQIVQRVIENMIGNALKYTPEGGTIRVSITEKGNRLIWMVSDTGPGVPVEFQSKVFDLFTHIPVSPIHRQASTGLGLAFCKLAIEAHQGRVSLESEPGKGSAFRFELPL